MKLHLILIQILILSNCNIDKSGKFFFFLGLNSTQTLPNIKEITEFSFTQISPPINAGINGNLITANLPSSISLNSLVADFKFQGKEVKVANQTQISGTSANNFLNELVYQVIAENSSTVNYSVKVNNTGFFILGSSGEINITGLSSTDSPLELFYDSNGNTFKSFANNTKIGIVLPANTSFTIGIKSSPTGKVCSLSTGNFSGLLNTNLPFSINCISGYLVGGKILSKLSTFSIPTNGGIVQTISGSFPPTAIAGTSDGIGNIGRLNQAYGITSDGVNLFIADSVNSCIRKFEIATNNLTTIAGGCGSTGTTDGIGNIARFNVPIFISTNGTSLFVSDRGNNSIRKMELNNNEVTTFAGLSGAAGDLDGTGTNARFNFPNGITTSGTYLYLSDRGNHKIKRIHLATRIVETIVGTGVIGSLDGNGNIATLNDPCESVSIGNNLYVSECGNCIIRKIELYSPFVVTKVFGSGACVSNDGFGLTASFNNPLGIETDGTNLFISEWLGQRIRRINLNTLQVLTIAGGTGGYQDGTGTGARLNNLGGITSEGNFLYFLDAYNHSLRRFNNAPD